MKSNYAGPEIERLLGRGSYKAAYALKNNADEVLVTVPKGHKASLEKELNDLATLAGHGIRVPKVNGKVFTVDDETVGVVMEKLKGVEVKEVRFGMETSKKTVLQAAQTFGKDKVISQLKAVNDYIQKVGGISDLQFFVSGEEGLVLFDPATLKTAEKNQGPASMIKYLESQK
jgi:RIO-like serine/threonine protein kinase